MKKISYLIILILLMTTVYAQFPPDDVSYFVFEAKNASSNLFYDGTFTVTETIFDALTAGSSLKTQTSSYIISNGTWAGKINNTGIDWSAQFFIELDVSGDTLSPRIQYVPSIQTQTALNVTTLNFNSMTYTGKLGMNNMSACSASEIYKFVGGEWQCASDAEGDNNFVTTATFTGTNEKTLTLERSGLGDVTGTFTDIGNSTFEIRNAINDTSLYNINVTGLSAIAGFACAGTDKVSSFLSNSTPVCTADGGGAGGNPFDQVLNTTSNVTFSNVTADAFQFNTAFAPECDEGLLTWNADDQTVNICTNISSTLQVNQETVFKAVNKEGVTILDGQAVFVNESQGNRPVVFLARADDTSTAMTLGIATGDIANNEQGFITTFGLVRDIDTSMFSDGDMLYLSATEAGNLTNVPPSFPNFRVLVGTVLNSHASQGIIFVHPSLDFTDGVTINELFVINNISAGNWSNVTITESQVIDLSHTNDTNCNSSGSCTLGGVVYNNSGGYNLTYVSGGTTWRYRDGGTELTMDLSDIEDTFAMETDNTKFIMFNEGTGGNNFKAFELSTAKAGSTSELYLQTPAPLHSAQFTRSLRIGFGNFVENCEFEDCDTGGSGGDLELNDTLFVGGNASFAIRKLNITDDGDIFGNKPTFNDWSDALDAVNITATYQFNSSGLTCTNCLNTDQIQDVYLLNSGDTGAGNYIFTDDVTVEQLLLETDTANHIISDNATCVIITGDTSTLNIC